MSIHDKRIFIALLTLIIPVYANFASAQTEPSPWGIAGSSSSNNNRDEWFPKMAAAGVSTIRLFPEWRGVEPTKGTWKWDGPDALVASAVKNKIEINAILMGSAPWSKGGGHAFPMNDLDGWSTYVGNSVGRYKDKIHYWEVWNEGNGGFNDDHHTAIDYGKLAASAYVAAKKADPTAKVGLSIASFDPAYLDHAIRSMAKNNAAGSFDFLAIHPYEIADGLADPDGEIPFLWMTHSLKEMLHRAAPDREKAEIWITEIGRKVGGNGTTEQDAAKGLIKLYTMALAQGIRRTQWFEGQDPAGEEAGFGLIERNGKPRVAYAAMKTMTRLLGPTPKYLGWLAMSEGERGYGFVFQGPTVPVLVTWLRAGEKTTNGFALPSPATVVNMEGNTTEVPAGKPITLDDSPLFVSNVPADVVSTATANAKLPFPWGGDFSTADSVEVKLGTPNGSRGLFQTAQKSTPHCTFPDGTTGIIVRGDQGVQFYAHPSFTHFEDREFYVRVTVRRLAPGNLGMNCHYAFADGMGKAPYQNVGDWFGVGKEDVWQTHTWHINNACFSKMWGHDISIRPEQSVPFVIGKVEVSKKPFR